jgi:hypothetical protein
METTGLLRDSIILSFPNECLSGSTPRKDGNPEVNHLNTYDSGLAMKAWIVVSDVSKDTQWRDLRVSCHESYLLLLIELQSFEDYGSLEH